MKVAFLDRDGTIINDYPDVEWSNIRKPTFIDGSIEALKALKDLGYDIIILTNQYIINMGIISLEQYNNFTNLFRDILTQNGIILTDILYCPHTKDENCNCYKPNIGLFQSALAKYPNINVYESFVVGDSLCDIEMGNRIGIRTFGIKLNSEKFVYTKIDSLAEVINYL